MKQKHKTKPTIKKISAKYIILAAVVLFLLYITWLFKFANNFPRAIDLKAPKNFWGITYSKRFASYLNLDWRQTYTDILDDLGAKNIRLPIYWQDVEPSEGVYDFSEYDWMINEGAKRNAKFVLVVGRRLPRWPECHVPEWSKKYPEEIVREKLIVLMKTIVDRYKDRPEVVAWQVENEPMLDSFGICPKADPDWLRQEVALVKNSGKKPILITASGELSNWKQESKLGDVFGTTLYRVVWNPALGYLRWPIPTWFYQQKLKRAGRDANKAIIAELQTEPWAPSTSLEKITLKEASKSFNISQFRGNLQYAINTGFSQSYLWGVEWWYLQKTRGNAELWEEAKMLDW